MVKNNRKVPKRKEEELPISSGGYHLMKENSSIEDSQHEAAEDTQESVESSDGNGNEFSDHENNLSRNNGIPVLSKMVQKRTMQAQKLEPSIKKRKNNEKVKPPTLEEINELKETRNLFHSNLFRLQVKEMLEELKIKEKYKKYFSTWLDLFKQFVNDLKSQQQKEHVSEKMEWIMETSLNVPLFLKHLNVNKQKAFQFQFLKPTAEPYYIGAVATQTLLGSKLVADVNLPMPAECFQKDNYLNLMYDQKRALYLTFIVHQMLKSKHFEGLTSDHLKFNYFANNPLKPVLEITPNVIESSSIAHRLCIRLFVVPEEKSFKLSRFVPWNCNVRATLFRDDEESLPLATPHYNAAVLFDLTMQRNQQLLRTTFDGHKNFQEGLILLKVWLQQRQLHVGHSGFQAHILAMFIAYLFKEHKLHTNMSSYQVARTVWNNLALSAWDISNQGISVCTAGDSKVANSPRNNAARSQNGSLPQSDVTKSHPTVCGAGNRPTLEQFHAFYDIVFVDVTGFHNICANVSLELYKWIRFEAKIAVDMLNDMKLNSFQSLFMTKYPIYTQFDHILKIHKKDVVEQILDMHAPPADKYDYVGHAYPQLLKIVTSLLRKGLDKRVYSILPFEKPCESWSPTSQPTTGAEYLHLGLKLNAEDAFNILEKGPESISEDAEEFRKFWGEKAELRRFQDGTITESVVWASFTDTLTEKRLIARSIVLHLLQHHLQLDASDVEYVGGEFDVAFKLTPAFKTTKLNEKYQVAQKTDAEALSLQVIRCFDDLARKLHALSELPLEIVTIAGISPVFRYCEPEPILQRARIINDKLYAPSVQYGTIQLGLSGKWPSELPALRAVKTAFYIQIAKLLNEKHKLVVKVTYDGILVLKQGYCFSLEIAHPKELALLKKQKTDRAIMQYVDSPESINLEKRHYILPKVTTSLHSLHQEHNSFGPTVMIAKRWLYTQLIDNELWPDECTELLIAAQYLRSNAQVCCSPQTGFIRFLHLLANTDWKTELFVVNFNNSIDENELTELEKRFNDNRDAFPPLSIATPYDQKHYGLLWATMDRPNVNVLARITLLARQSLAIIEDSLYSTEETFIRAGTLFKASNKGYDLVIQLKPDLVPNTLAYEFGSPFAILGNPNWRLPLAGTDFVKDAVAKLREAYSEFCAFFYNPRGGKEIAIVWRPLAVFCKKPFKVTEVNGCLLNDDGKSVQCNKDTLVEDFKFILKDFYLRIGTVNAIFQASKDSNKFVNTKQRYFSQPVKDEIGSPTETRLSNDKIRTKNITKSKQRKVKIINKRTSWCAT